MLEELPEYQKLAFFFKHSEELAQLNPMISYYFKLYAVRKASDILSKIKAEPAHSDKVEPLTNKLRGWVPELEKLKTTTPGLNDKEANKTEILSWAGNFLEKFDEQDKAGDHTKQLALDWRFLSRLIEIATVFGPLDQEWEGKKKYALSRALEVSRSVGLAKPKPEAAQPPPPAEEPQGGNNAGGGGSLFSKIPKVITKDALNSGPINPAPQQPQQPAYTPQPPAPQQPAYNQPHPISQPQAPVSYAQPAGGASKKKVKDPVKFAEFKERSIQLVSRSIAELEGRNLRLAKEQAQNALSLLNEMENMLNP